MTVPLKALPSRPRPSATAHFSPVEGSEPAASGRGRSEISWRPPGYARPGGVTVPFGSGTRAPLKRCPQGTKPAFCSVRRDATFVVAQGPPADGRPGVHLALIDL